MQDVGHEACPANRYMPRETRSGYRRGWHAELTVRPLTRYEDASIGRVLRRLFPDTNTSSSANNRRSNVSDLDVHSAKRVHCAAVECRS